MSLLTLDQFLSQSPLASFPPRSYLVGDDAPEGEPTRQTMYLTDKARAVYFCNNAGLTPPEPQQEQMVLAESSGDDHEVKVPKKRAETWAQEETRCLITFRREIDGLFNTSKSNKHLWEQISAKMREKGYDRSPTMCTDKWRNLLKEFKKAKHQSKGRGSAKMSSYKELDELLKERSKKAGCKGSSASKVNAYLQFSDKGLEDANAPFGPAEGSDRSPLNLDRSTEHDRHPLAIMTIDAVAASGVPPWNWRDTSVNDNNASYRGRVILVKWGDYLRRIGIDGTREAIKEAIKSAFGLRTKRAFWLEDEDNVVRCLDREMPIGSYTLHLDEGITIKLCIYDENDRLHTEEKTLYTEDELHLFLLHRGWAGLRDMSGLKNVDTLDDLCPGGLYQGVRMLVD